MPEGKKKRDEQRKKLLGKGEARRAADKITSRAARIEAAVNGNLDRIRNAQSTDSNN